MLEQCQQSMNVCVVSDFGYILLFQYLDKMIKRDFKNLHTYCFKLLHLPADIEIKISLFLHVVVHEPFKGPMNYCFGSA